MDAIGSYSALWLLSESAKFKVYKGWEEEIQRHVIVKVITIPEDDDGFVQACLELKNEAQILGVLRHRFLTPVYQFRSKHTHPFLALEYFRGQSLLELIEKKYQLGLHQIVLILSKLADVLAYLHAQQIYHADISLANILINQQFDVRLIDFGLARSTPSHGKRQRPQGTPDFLSPELLDGRAIDHRSDLYSLAIVLHVLLTGDSPYPGKTAEEVLQARHLEELRFRPPVPSFGMNEEAFFGFLKKALAYAPDDRYANIQEFVQAFAAVIKKDLPAPDSELVEVSADDGSPESTIVYNKMTSTVIIPADVAPWLEKADVTGEELAPFDAELMAAELPKSPMELALDEILNTLESEQEQPPVTDGDGFSPQRYRNAPIQELTFLEVS